MKTMEGYGPSPLTSALPALAADLTIRKLLENHQFIQMKRFRCSPWLDHGILPMGDPTEPANREEIRP